ncbi:MAG: ASCH domain-containing protein [Proteobacteria bacterium]|nr:ASCH domain-containing protein [Pseudomonadota bacterium]
MTSEVAAFWRSYRAAHPEGQAQPYDVFAFADTPAVQDELAALVLAGTKRATTALVAAYAHEGQRPPEPGDESVVLDGGGHPVCVIRTTRTDRCALNAVGAEFAAVEGEGDGSLAYWMQVHVAYFQRECAAMGLPFRPDAAVVCERFEVVYRA